MTPNQKLFSLFVCLFVFVFVVDLVRRKKLREEYSILWLFTSVLMFVLVLKYDWLLFLTSAIGAVIPTTTLFLGAIIFLMLVCIQFSIKISKLTDQLKNLAQDNALLRGEVTDLRRTKPADDSLDQKGRGEEK